VPDEHAGSEHAGCCGSFSLVSSQHAIIVRVLCVQRHAASDNGKLLACRPPLLGFKHMQPRLGINMRGHMGNKSDETALPTASTCFNLLKLPPFPDEEVMREKLILAIEAGTGFELS
jgi:HECT-domain (ubiquitin-transferase)